MSGERDNHELESEGIWQRREGKMTKKVRLGEGIEMVQGQKPRGETGN